MQFALTDEQRALQDAVRSWLTDRLGTDGVRAVVEDPAGDGNPDELWKACGEQGWLAVLVPEAYDGLGLGLLDASVIARCFGAATAPGPWQCTTLAAEAVRLGGSPDQQARWLPRVASGDAVITLATRVAGGQWAAAGAAYELVEGRLTGAAASVEYAHLADALVCAATDGSLHLVDPTAAGVRIERHETTDATTRLATVHLDGVQGEALPGKVLDEVYLRGAALVAADLVGIARQALVRTVAYDRDRVQFGKPVGSFQALKHALADLAVAVTMAEHGALYAAHALDEDLPDAKLAVHVAKAKASDVARDATAAMIQFHGGIGYTWEHDAHFFFKRAKREEYLFGAAAHHREQVARLTVDRA